MSTLHFQVVNGTRANEARLCDSCADGVVMRGSSRNEEIVFCEEMQRNVGIHVVECNRYKVGGQPSLYDMREIAWVLQTDSKRQKIGFHRLVEDGLAE